MILLFLAALTPAGHAQVYTWKDETGRVHYGDQPPAGARELEDRVSTVDSAYEQHQRELQAIRRQRAAEARRALLDRTPGAVIYEEYDDGPPAERDVE